MDLPKRMEKGFDYAIDSVKQLLTLSTGVLAVTVTFAKNVTSAPKPAVWLMLIVWLLYLASIFMGMFALWALTGDIASNTESTNKRDEGQDPKSARSDTAPSL
jgi:ABC-type Na+ efflux pump permease subunit